MRKSVSLLFGMLFAFGLLAQSTELKFNDKGEFKIIQFTDLHFSFPSTKNDTTLMTIRTIAEIEKPDLLIFTGDVVTDIPAREGWYKLGHTLEQIGIPWTITLGNHDDEPSIGRGEIFDLVRNMPYFIGEKGPEITGYGNYVLRILGRNSGKPAGILYCMDSNGFGKISKLSGYDWFHLDQILWYRAQSEAITASNDDKPLPSLAFFHIPLPEYKELGDEIVGNKPARVSSPDINSGMFVSMLDRNDIMGMFVGHDHNNDYIGKYKDIALAYGRVTGADASGRLERGGRVIVMYEDEYRFDTWIRTPSKKEFEYRYLSNRIEGAEEITEYLPAQKTEPKQKGLRYAYYEGNFLNTDDVLKAEPLKRGIAPTITLDLSSVKDSFALVFEGYIKIAETDVYSFYIVSDDGSRLYIDDRLVVDNDGSHAGRRREGLIGLEKGFHKFRLIYFENYWGEHLEAGYAGKNLRESRIPAYVLFSD